MDPGRTGRVWPSGYRQCGLGQWRKTAIDLVGCEPRSAGRRLGALRQTRLSFSLGCHGLLMFASTPLGPQIRAQRMSTNDSERGCAELESGLGSRPHEFESRILRHSECCCLMPQWSLACPFASPVAEPEAGQPVRGGHRAARARSHTQGSNYGPEDQHESAHSDGRRCRRVNPQGFGAMPAPQ